MSDLRERFNASPELHEPSPEAVELEADRKREAETPTARQVFLNAHPEFSALQREEVSGANKVAVLEKVKAFRLDNLKKELEKQDNDLTEQEKAFAAEVLALRISRRGSVRELLDEVHRDSAEDFARAVVDAKELRRLKAKHDSLRGRYKTMGDFKVTAESFVVRGQ